MREFGVAPEFRGGLHGGRVITAQVGHIKRAIDLSGDVMNTTSRLQSLAKELKADLTITQELRDRMPDADKRFTFGDAELLRVKGGKRQMGVRTVARKVVAATLNNDRRMMRYLFTCLVLFMIGLTGIHAQSVVPVITSYGRLVVFQKVARR
ncbi:MAG: hypothetical protein IPI95_15320 [Flavobacteriales bacterium]|nr:hypothetical protein [Flavobacteriales bacterium]